MPGGWQAGSWAVVLPLMNPFLLLSFLSSCYQSSKPTIMSNDILIKTNIIILIPKVEEVFRDDLMLIQEISFRPRLIRPRFNKQWFTNDIFPEQDFIAVGCVPPVLSLSWGAGGGLCLGSHCPRGSLSRGVSVQKVSVHGSSLSMGVSVRGGSLSRGGGLCQGDPLTPRSRMTDRQV